MTLTERFLRYVSFETTSSEQSPTTPSTSTQMLLAKAIRDELLEMGLQDVSLDNKGYLMATLPANTDAKKPVIGFIAHLDTSPDASGRNIAARIVKNYDGSDIVLNPTKNIVLQTAVYPEILHYIGNDIIVTDGTTLLGADDKAGVAEIITAMEYLLQNPQIQHGKVRIGFTPDEEIGRGADFFDVKKFGAEWAYTMDGGSVGELEYENFNAASAKIVFSGINVHPGSAYKKMRNALLLATRFAQQLPSEETPATTQGYQGFYHLVGMTGTVEEASLSYIIRDHDRFRFEARKHIINKLADDINSEYGEQVAVVTIRDQYYNMKEKVEPVMHIIDLAKQAIAQAGVTPIVKPIRGGTDGARLSYEGLPCPNIFAGGENFHSRFEYLPIQSMNKAYQTILNIIQLV